ncbi:MAG: hypothetical protein RLY43_608, partial [Bacteroidota bacterium]
WGSSQKEVIVKVNVNTKNELIVLQRERENSTIQKKAYRISGIDKINGFLGIVVFNVCETEGNNECTKIQFNKVFGVPQVINITYENRVSNCFSPDDGCTRAFKRVE